MRIDLHTHSLASDGTVAPADLMTAASAAGLDVIGLTDHDTTAGWAAAAAALPTGLTLVRGAEFSTYVTVPRSIVSVHLLAYLFDPLDPVIVREQERLRAERLQRGLQMVELMMADGLPITQEQVLAIAAGAPVGRPHIGRALVESGVVASVDEAFDGYLAGRGSYYVPKLDIELLPAVRMIVAAGGAPVVAHPRGRGEGRALTPELIAELAAAGLVGLEVDHLDHDDADRAELRGIAAELGLVVTGSSDFHGTNKKVQLGANLTDPAALEVLVARTSGVTPLVTA